MKPHGIVRLSFGSPWYLGYGWKHGFGCGWMPDFLQGWIVGGWNRTVCAFRGHEELDIPAHDDWPSHYVPCVMCSHGDDA
jgi:hypothetical protein